MNIFGVILLLTCCSCKEEVSTTLHVLAVLSVEEGDNSSTAWTQGTHIFQGACHATVDINNSSDLLAQYELVPVPVLVPDCDPVRGLHSLLEALLDPAMNIVGVTGMFCDRVAQVYSPVLTHWARRLDISGAQIQDRAQLLPSLQPSPQDVAEAVVSILYSLNWKRFGIVYLKPRYNQYSYYNYINLTRSIREVIKLKHSESIPVSYELSGGGQREVSVLLQSLKSSGVHIFVVLLSHPIATVVMQEASKEGLVWPHYVWMFVHLDPATLSQSPELENVLFMSYSVATSDSSSSKGVHHWTPYSSLLYESVWALAVTWNNSIINFSNISTSLYGYKNQNTSFAQNEYTNIFKRTCGGSHTSQFNVAVIQRNKVVMIGLYDCCNLSLSLNDSIIQPIPPDTFQFVFLVMPLELSIPLSFWILLLYILMTVNLILFLLLRKEHEIKASSIPLSMCIFVGNYLLLLCTTNSVIETSLIVDKEKIRHTTCNVEQVAASVGFDIVVATALVRTLRIYHIFHYIGKLKRSWSDSRLVTVIAVIISIKLFLFVLWISVDNNHLTDTSEFQREAVPPYYLVTQPCYSDYQAVWAVAVYMYTVILLALLFSLAIKTRKVNHHDFKDTKKLTSLVLGLLIILLVFGLLWGILRQIGYPMASIVCLNFGYSFGVFIIQMSLFLPKVIPPLYRKIKKVRRAESRATSTNQPSIQFSTTILTTYLNSKK